MIGFEQQMTSTGGHDSDTIAGKSAISVETASKELTNTGTEAKNAKRGRILSPRLHKVL